MMDFNKELSLRSAEAEEIIRSLLPKASEFDSELIEAMNYSVMAGGKRLRPILIQSFCRLFGGKEQIAYPFMAAMEMVHTYSLVHDDLPAIDNDDLRRGQPTTHKKYGEATAILAGDGLLHEAHEIIADALVMTDPSNLNSMINAFGIFTHKCGIHGMLGGQAADVIHTGEWMSDELMQYVYDYKTGALIEGSMMIGAALGGANPSELQKIEKIGSLVGLAFQIRDDILDLTGDAAILGKPVLSDEKNSKKTYVTVHGMKKSYEDIAEFSDEAKALLGELGNNEAERGFLMDLIEELTKRVK